MAIMIYVDWGDRGEKAGYHIRISASKLVEQILKNDSELNKQKIAGPILLTFAAVLFYLVIERNIPDFVTSGQRSIFLDSMLNNISVEFSKLWNDPAGILPAVRDEISDNMDKLSPYAKHIYTYKNKNKKGTLYWEFSKILSGDFGVSTKAARQARVDTINASLDLLGNIKYLFSDTEAVNLDLVKMA
ncbi:MAG TPA: hypothetical protein VMR76_03190 [Candidatus Saccharimonadia bacterium]|nr:hypothetical protein [Candidatus Saccharimonadia bacterium]